jgi:hypothetical protein
MKYTQGIRKIFSPQFGAGTHINEVAQAARENGFKLFSFNGDVYIALWNSQLYTGLTLEDFEA